MSGATTAAELKEQIEAEREGLPFLVFRDGDGTQRIIIPAGTQATLGRSPAADLSLSWDNEVSHVHAELLRVGDAWTLTDDGLSRNGTFINGERVAGRRRLRDGDVVRVGATEVRFRAPSEHPLAQTSVAVDVPEAAEPGTIVPAGEKPSGTVTVLFTDIVGSTATTERVGDRRWIELLEEHNALLRAQLAAHAGFEVKSTGDGFMFAFGSARDGLECAIGIQRALAERNAEHSDEPIRVRTGLHTGEPIWGDRDFHGRGIALAARIGAKAGPGEILVSALLRELTESLGDFTFEGHREVKLKGLSGRHRVHSVRWAQ